MNSHAAAIESLALPVAEEDLDALARLLLAAVASGAAVSFAQTLTLADARAWWTRTIQTLPPRGLVLVARCEGCLVGTVQLQPAWAPNQPHRADVVKLLVQRDFQQQGLGERLMLALESAARSAGFSLLTLDAKAGTPAERLYRKIGWTALGTIPRYAQDPDGALHDAIFMYRELPADAASAPNPAPQ